MRSPGGTAQENGQNILDRATGSDRLESIAMESLTGLTAFVHAVEGRGYVAAGRILGGSPSAIAKSVTRLEARLGVRLLNRTTRSLAPTEQGGLFYERCNMILDDIRDPEAALSQSRARPAGRLRVSVPQIFGHRLLLPHLPDFSRRYPEIDLDIDFEDRVVDIVAEGLDVAVRSGTLVDSRVIARQIGAQHFVVCGSPGYVEGRGRPAEPADLEAHRCIHSKYPSSGKLAPWSFAPPDDALRLPTSLVFNNTDAGLWAAIEGLGLAHLPDYVARPAIRDGRLQPFLRDFMVPFGALWSIWPTNRHLSPKLRAFVDFVLESVGETLFGK